MPSGLLCYILIIRLFGAEVILAYCAEGAYEIFGNIFPLGAGQDAALGIALCLVIDPAANIAYIFHIETLLFVVFYGLSIPRFSETFRRITAEEISPTGYLTVLFPFL